MPGSGTESEIRGLTIMWGGEGLHAQEHSAADLHRVLSSIGRKTIVQSIEANFAHTLDQNPGVTVYRPSVHVITLGSDRSNILSSYGQHNRTGLSRSIIEIQPKFRAYWETIEFFGFSPEVRRFIGRRTLETIALLMRNPETNPPLVTPLEHLPRALGFLEPAVTRDIQPHLAEALASDDTDSYRMFWNQLEDANDDAIDRQVQSFDESVRPPAQIGRMVAVANLRVALRGDEYLLGEDGYTADIADAEEGAYQYGLDEVSDLLKEEIARIRGLQV